jgi:hypothetical protein
MFKAVGYHATVPETEHEYYRFVFEMQEDMSDPISAAASAAVGAAKRQRTASPASSSSLTGVQSVGSPSLQPPAAQHSSSSADVEMHARPSSKRKRSDSAPEPASDSMQQVALYFAKLSVVQLFSDVHDPKHKPGCAKKGTKDCRFNVPHRPALQTDVSLSMFDAP